MSSLRDARLTLEEVRKIYEASQTTTFDTADKLVDAQLRKARVVIADGLRELWQDLYGQGFEVDNPAMERILAFAEGLEAEGIEPWKEKQP